MERDASRDKVRAGGATFSKTIELINPRKTRHKQSAYCRCHKLSSIIERDTQLSKEGLRLMIKEQTCHCIACHHDANPAKENNNRVSDASPMLDIKIPYETMRVSRSYA